LPDPFQLFFSKACGSALETAIQLSIEHNAELPIFQTLDYRLTEFDGRHPKVADWANYTETDEWRKLETEFRGFINLTPILTFNIFSRIFEN
jgi:hypothetical protein